MISSHILSELSLLCTDYLFINKGELLQAVSAADLKKICREYYRIHTDNDPLALAVLRDKLGVTQYDIEKDGSIRLYEMLDDMRTVSKTLYEGGVIPLLLNINEANLESYYMNMVGGESNVQHHKGDELSDKA